MACGTPVIAFARGGAAETVRDGVTGRLFQEQSVPAIIAAVDAFERGPQSDHHACRERALMFSPERFRERFMAFATTTGVQ
jgi:glycosyltransferase involved in cell wall biosynthesis